LPSILPSTSNSPSESLSPTLSRNSQFISLSELRTEIVRAFRLSTAQATAQAEEVLDKVPPIPNSTTFTVARPGGKICKGNDKAVSVDVTDDSDTLTLTFCSLLQYNLSKAFSADDLLADFDGGFLDLSLEGGFDLSGALTFGAQISVEKNISNPDPTISFDPITIQLAVDGGLETVASFGMIEASGDAGATLTGDFGLVYCPSPDCTENEETFDGVEYNRTSNSSSFYLSRNVGYDIKGGLSIGADIPGLEVETGLTFGLKDDNVFDDISVEVTLPNSQALIDSLKFSPMAAVKMLRLMDVVSIYIICCFLLKMGISNSLWPLYLSLLCRQYRMLYETRHLTQMESPLVFNIKSR